MTRTAGIADTLLGVLGHFDTLLGLGVLGNDYSDAGHGGGGEFPTKETDDAKMSKQVLVHYLISDILLRQVKIKHHHHRICLRYDL